MKPGVTKSIGAVVTIPQAMDGHIVYCSTISSRQSAATYEIIKHCRSLAVIVL